MEKIGKLFVEKFYPLMDRFLPEKLALKIKLILCILHGNWQFCNFTSEDMAFGLLADNAQEKIDRLLNGLDPDSKNKTKRLIERATWLCEMRHHILFKISHFFWKEELEEQQKFAKEMPKLIDRYKVPGAPIEVLIYHNGLTLLPQAAKEYISGKDFLDIGAFIGDSAVIFTQYDPGKIYSFDISAKNRAKYFNTMRENNIPEKKFEFVHAAVGDRDNEEISFSDIGGGSTNLATKGSSKVSATTIDSFVQKNSLNVGLVKFDVEGVGFQVTKGMAETLKQHRPVLLLAIYHNSEELFEIKPFIENLNLNYTFIMSKLNPHHILSELILIGYPSELDAGEGKI